MTKWDYKKITEMQNNAAKTIALATSQEKSEKETLSKVTSEKAKALLEQIDFMSRMAPAERIQVLKEMVLIIIRSDDLSLEDRTVVKKQFTATINNRTNEDRVVLEA